MSTYSNAARALALLTFASVCMSAPGCTQAISLHTATNPSASFVHYRTFTIGQLERTPRGYDAYPIIAEVAQRLRPLVVGALTRRGYTLADANGDLYVRFGSGRREIPVHESREIGGSWLPDDENDDFVQGAIVVDVFDSITSVRVWHGRSSIVSDSSFRDSANLGRLVDQLLEAFPVGSGPPSPAAAASP